MTNVTWQIFTHIISNSGLPEVVKLVPQNSLILGRSWHNLHPKRQFDLRDLNLTIMFCGRRLYSESHLAYSKTR